jgi:Tol biopolymer transport system component
VLVYRSAAGAQNVLLELDRAGKSRALGPSRVWVPRVSPDGRRVVYGHVGDGQLADLWVYDRRLGNSQRLTSGGEEGPDYNDPVWSPDGRRLAMSAINGNDKDLYAATADGGAPPTLLLHRPGEQWPSDWTRDGREVLFTDVPPDKRRAIMALSLTKGAEPRTVVQTAYNATGGRLSPDGAWLAYDSDETGRNEVYLQRFPGPGGKTRISTEGGGFPVWSRDGRELYYWSDNRLVSVQLRLGAELAVLRREILFQAFPEQGGVLAQFDVLPDGKHFVLASGGAGENRIAVVTDVRTATGHLPPTEARR